MIDKLSAAEKREAGWKIAAQLTLRFLLVVPYCVLQGWVLTVLWRWLIVPSTGGALPLSLASGTLLMFRFMLPAQKAEPMGFGMAIFATPGKCALWLAMGWVLHLFVGLPG